MSYESLINSWMTSQWRPTHKGVNSVIDKDRIVCYLLNLASIRKKMVLKESTFISWFNSSAIERPLLWVH